ncbi:phosphoadenosine phosphosulfate reductase family protein [Stenotrophomonas maltophilia]|uniref:phosphoadenosine phosphosulfate reductase domain-containing protein n=1 Tax=Stenotrophomonas maltophilia TaxID=40324 RepID=UPI0039C0B7A0
MDNSKCARGTILPAESTGGCSFDSAPAKGGTGSMPDIESLIAKGALFVANHSGGKDSQAMLIRLLERVPASQIIVIHASLGEVEWEGALEHAKHQADDAGLPFIVATAVKTLFEMVEHRFKVRPGPNSPCWPSSANRQCTSDLKRGPVEREVRRYAKEHGFKTIVSCLGIRAKESPGRAKRPSMSRNDRGSIAGRDWYEWLPIHELTTDEVFSVISAAGQQPHWAYAAGNDRLSCVFCIMGSAKDLANGARHRPELYAKYREIEERTGYSMHQSRRTLDVMVAQGQEALAHMATMHAPHITTEAAESEAALIA